MHARAYSQVATPTRTVWPCQVSTTAGGAGPDPWSSTYGAMRLRAVGKGLPVPVPPAATASSRGRRSTWARDTVRRIPRVSARTVAALATRRQPAGHRPQPRETPPAGSSGHHRIGRTSEAPDDGPRAEPPTAAQRAGHTTAPPPVHLTCTARAAAASVAVRSRAVLQRVQVRRATVKPNPSALRYGGYVPPTGGTRCTSRRQQGAGCVCVYAAGRSSTCQRPGGEKED
jgi:hypothetical protein